MANIKLVDRSLNSIKVQLENMQSDYSGSQRTLYWNIKKNSDTTYTTKEEVKLGQNISATAPYTFTNLSPSTRYNIQCVVNNASDSTLATLFLDVWTLDATPHIDSLSITTSTGNTTATIQWTCSQTIWSTTYEIIVDGTTVKNGRVRDTSKTNIDFESFGRHQVMLVVATNDKTSSKSKQVTITDYDLTPTNLTVNRESGGTLKLQWSGATDATSFVVRAKLLWKNTTSSQTVSTRSATMRGLDCGYRYEISVAGKYLSKQSDYAFNYSVTPLPAEPVLTISASGDTISVDYSIPETSNFTTIYVNLYDSEGNLKKKGSTPTSRSGTITFSSVEDGTYEVRARTVFSTTSYTDYDSTNSWMSGQVSAQIVVTSKPSAWSWTSSNGNATSTRTKNAYQAITNNGLISAFHYTVWNDLVDKVKEVLEYKGLAWDASYTTYEEAKLSQSNTLLTAAKFNSVRYNIGIHYSTGINEQTKGDVVYGSYFTTLTQKLNQWI